VGRKAAWLRADCGTHGRLRRSEYSLCAYRCVRAWFLKLARNLGSERDRLEWIDGRISAPCVIGFRPGSERDALLTSAVDGANLASLCKVWPREQTAERLADALRVLHAVPAADCPFADSSPCGVLLHGDACLPNVMFHDNGDLSGFVDLGEMRVGDAEVDLSAAVWSLQFNLGPGIGLSFLRQYGVSGADDRKVERLCHLYESRSS